MILKSIRNYRQKGAGNNDGTFSVFVTCEDRTLLDYISLAAQNMPRADNAFTARYGPVVVTVRRN